MSLVKRRANSKITAEYVNSTESTWRQARAKKLRNPTYDHPEYYKVGRRIIYDLDEVDSWLEKHRMQGSPG